MRVQIELFAQIMKIAIKKNHGTYFSLQKCTV